MHACLGCACKYVTHRDSFRIAKANTRVCVFETIGSLLVEKKHQMPVHMHRQPTHRRQAPVASADLVLDTGFMRPGEETDFYPSPHIVGREVVLVSTGGGSLLCMQVCHDLQISCLEGSATFPAWKGSAACTV